MDHELAKAARKLADAWSLAMDARNDMRWNTWSAWTLRLEPYMRPLKSMGPAKAA